MSNEIIETKRGNNTQITTLESTFIMPESTIQAIASRTNDREEAIELLAYLKDRIDNYNSEIETTRKTYDLKESKFKYSASFTENLFTSLLDLGFTPDLIIVALDSQKDSTLFGNKTIKLDKEEEARVAYICNLVKACLYYDPEYYTEEDTYSNVDELELKYNRG